MTSSQKQESVFLRCLKWKMTTKSASFLLTGETINMPAHISFMWGDDGKIAAEYHMYDTSQMVAGIEAAQAAAMME